MKYQGSKNGALWVTPLSKIEGNILHFAHVNEALHKHKEEEEEEDEANGDLQILVGEQYTQRGERFALQSLNYTSL
ncbi:hypothetical protein GOP47_0007711 [Adiantum capillus-veneris]|uniref:Uncharacterized protein n=1 Tax=Adiantum capillus-veneris TaxID=13818 RepID=A0A9D4ZL71_ADICA|nr:hypothetical protein GOP47_0007711 [Adiantum capillus-veneris]